MIFSIGSQFSREFSHEESNITHILKDELNIVFENKNYGNRINKVYIGVICVSKGFEPFFKIRPLKIYKTEKALEYELKLDFETFKLSNKEERKSLLIDEFLKKTKECLMKKTINGFEKEKFIKDLEYYFKNNQMKI